MPAEKLETVGVQVDVLGTQTFEDEHDWPAGQVPQLSEPPI